jgi:hypothetical protein
MATGVGGSVKLYTYNRNKKCSVSVCV